MVGVDLYKVSHHVDYGDHTLRLDVTNIVLATTHNDVSTRLGGGGGGGEGEGRGEGGRRERREREKEGERKVRREKSTSIIYITAGSYLLPS